MPKVSIIMPVYNAEKYIESAIESVIQQTYSDIELILVDDCGNDRSIEIASKIIDKRIKIIRNDTNMGIAQSRNIGLRYATGQYIALMDDDDLCPRDRVWKQKEFLDSNKQIDVVGGRYEIINEGNKRIKLMPEPLNNPKYIKSYMMFYNPMANGSAMFRSDFIYKNQIQYQENCFGMEDYRFWIDCSLKGTVTNLSDVLLSWRTTSFNETSRCVFAETKQRAEKYAEIQKYAIRKNGFCFCEDDLNFLNSMFPENIGASIVATKDLERLYEILSDMKKQAYAMGLWNKQEIAICCKKMFSLRVENSNIW